MRLRFSAWIGTVAILFLPAAQASADGPEEFGSQTTADGVTVSVRADEWHGVPYNLDDVIPLLVTIENNGPVPIRLRYNDFKLAGDRGQVAALPPSEIRGHETEASPYAYTWSGYYGWPYARYAGAYYYDPWFYPGYYPSYVRIELPTEDMIDKALPQTVVDVGERVSGYLYLDRVHPGKHDSGTFSASLIETSSGSEVGAVRIPLEIY